MIFTKNKKKITLTRHVIVSKDVNSIRGTKENSCKGKKRREGPVHIVRLGCGDTSGTYLSAAAAVRRGVQYL